MKIFVSAALCVAGFAGMALPAAADTRSDVLARVAHCSALPEGRQWLQCYYAAAQPARAALGLSPAPQAPAFETLFGQPAPVAPTPAASAPDSDSGGIFGMFASTKVPADQFGLKGAKPGRGVNVDRIIDKMASYTIRADGFIVTLAGGQVWKYTGSEKVRWREPAATYTALITHGALGTFNLRIQGGKDTNNTVYKVMRLH